MTSDNGANTIVAVDSLVANEFEVHLEGERLLGVFRIMGLTPYKIDLHAPNSGLIREPFQLAKMVQRDGNSPFNRWLRETVSDREGRGRATRTLAIVAIDDGVETRRWTVKGAYIIGVTYSPFDSGSSEMVEELVTVHYEDIEESWPATTTLE
jgi:hypothetical protein